MTNIDNLTTLTGTLLNKIGNNGIHIFTSARTQVHKRGHTGVPVTSKTEGPHLRKWPRSSLSKHVSLRWAVVHPAV